MSRSATALLSVSRLAAGAFVAAVIVASSPVKADVALPESALVVRNAVVAMSLADAALPFATAVALEPADAAAPASHAALKPSASDAMAAMRPARRQAVSAEAIPFERRIPAYRAYRDVFPLILGIGY